MAPVNGRGFVLPGELCPRPTAPRYMYPTTFHPDEMCMSPLPGEHKTMSSLRVLPLQYADGRRVMVSAWMPTAADLERLNSGKPIYLGVLAPGQPPVMVTTESEDLGF